MSQFEKFIAELGEQNKKFYSTTDGRGTLKGLNLVFEHSWFYLCELIQNALDAEADSIKISIDEEGDALIFQHNGTRLFKKKDVKGISKVYQSTKGARSVGFMGIGFKSVFQRFQEVRISDIKGWKFKFTVHQKKNKEFGDVQRDRIGVVVPIWDSEIITPNDNYTTRFELRTRIKKELSLKEDIGKLLPKKDRSILAILAMAGLTQLQVKDHIWSIGISEKSEDGFEVTALSERESRLWRVFSEQFKPSKKAIASFLEHREIQPDDQEKEKVYRDVSRVRHVWGVLPLDNEGNPQPPKRGKVYATLPTEVKLPFGIHVSADWLLDIRRGDLREVDSNPWQIEIVEKIACILGQVLKWSAKTFTNPDTVKATFGILRPPSSELSSFESLIAGEQWLSKFRDYIENANVIPVWGEKLGELEYASSVNTLVPPSPFMSAFSEQPNLRPAVLLRGQVLMNCAIGRQAKEFLTSIRILNDLLPKELEEKWENGLEEWWCSLPNEDEIRRDLLFLVWGAVAEIVTKEGWGDLTLPCLRSIEGNWQSVEEATYLNEALPREDKSYGREVRQFLEPFIEKDQLLDPKWVTKLRGVSKQDPEYAILSRIWNWIDDEARRVTLPEILRKAIDQLMQSEKPDSSVLVSIGHWAKNGNRTDLLTHVLVESENDQQIALLKDSLLADPYVDHGQIRRQLFPGVPVIAADYLDKDPNQSSRHDWHNFFEKNGAKGELKVVESKKYVLRWSGREKAANFLGLSDIGESNDNGYTLLNFDIEPKLPSSESPKEVLDAVAKVLEDGYRVLKGTGLRKVTYHYYYGYSPSGSKKSNWTIKLSELKWVPCDDGVLRRPREVLGSYDPAREDVPFAKLSSDLVSLLEQEGVNFGTEIPEATPLKKLSVLDISSSALEIAQLLKECRELNMKENDQKLFHQVIDELEFPTIDGSRVRLQRVVQKSGSGKGLRGRLGSWIYPLAEFEETLRKELTHSEFPFDFPETTTGMQSLNFIFKVWNKAKSDLSNFVDDVGEYLPTAYGYLRRDLDDDSKLNDRWQCSKNSAMVFVNRQWVYLQDVDDVYFDDIEDRRFIPSNSDFRTATSGHLGNSRQVQQWTAKELGIPKLSSAVNINWKHANPQVVSKEWQGKFALICDLLESIRRSQSSEIGIRIDGSNKNMELNHVEQLTLIISVGDSPEEIVPINARRSGDTLTVAGLPIQFGSDAAKELLSRYSFRQRGDLATDLTTMFIAIDSDDFKFAAEKFQRGYTPGFELPEILKRLPSGENVDELEDTSGAKNLTANGGESVGSDESDEFTSGQRQSNKSNDGNLESDSDKTRADPSYTKGQALAKPKFLVQQLRTSLKGEIQASSQDHVNEESDSETGGTGPKHEDTEYRKIVMRYELDEGRKPIEGGPNQAGWDIRSSDPKTNEVRYIEVKGRGRPWTNDEVVELSSAQVNRAFKDQTSWHLYVVEKLENGTYEVLPIGNPICDAAKWILCGEFWREVAEKPKNYSSEVDFN